MKLGALKCLLVISYHWKIQILGHLFLFESSNVSFGFSLSLQYLVTGWTWRLWEKPVPIIGGAVPEVRLMKHSRKLFLAGCLILIFPLYGKYAMMVRRPWTTQFVMESMIAGMAAMRAQKSALVIQPTNQMKLTETPMKYKQSSVLNFFAECGDGQKIVNFFPPLKTVSAVCNGFSECANGYDESGIYCNVKQNLSVLGWAAPKRLVFTSPLFCFKLSLYLLRFFLLYIH